MIIRLLTFKPTWPGDVTDQFLRHDVIPGLVARPGLTGVYAARGSGEEGDERIVTSVWATKDMAPVAAPEAAARELEAPFDFELGEVVSEPRVEVLVPAFIFDFDRPEPAQILRIFRGTVLAGRLEAYVEEARAGTMADTAAEHGPHVLYLSRLPPDAFVTVSVWSGWDRIQAATGGNIREPLATQHSHLLESWTAAHYEIVPNTLAGRPVESPADADARQGGGPAPRTALAVPDRP